MYSAQQNKIAKKYYQWFYRIFVKGDKMQLRIPSAKNINNLTHRRTVKRILMIYVFIYLFDWLIRVYAALKIIWLIHRLPNCAGRKPYCSAGENAGIEYWWSTSSSFHKSFFRPLIHRSDQGAILWRWQTPQMPPPETIKIYFDSAKF